MKSEEEIYKVLEYLEQIKKTRGEYDETSADDVDKALDVLRWVTEELDEDGAPSMLGMFLDSSNNNYASSIDE